MNIAEIIQLSLFPCEFIPTLRVSSYSFCFVSMWVHTVPFFTCEFTHCFRMSSHKFSIAITSTQIFNHYLFGYFIITTNNHHLHCTMHKYQCTQSPFPSTYHAQISMYYPVPLNRTTIVTLPCENINVRPFFPRISFQFFNVQLC